MQTKNNRAIIKTEAPPGYVPLRGASGRLYGYINPQTLIVEFKKGRESDPIDLKPYLQGGVEQK